MGFVLKYTNHPVKVSIIPRGAAALGFSQQKPTNDKLMVKEEVLCRIAVLLGGRCAEKIIYDNFCGFCFCVFLAAFDHFLKWD